jgi:aminoglycoside 2'-N-acetyltransferase I
MESNQERGFRIEIIAATQLPPDGEAAILALAQRAYGKDLEPLYRTFHAPTHGIGYLDNSMVSHALWVTRWLQPGTLPPLRTAYVEFVATDPAYQGQGYATAVLRQLAQAIADADFDLGGLCPSDPHFYTRLGWILWGGPLSIRGPEGLIPTPNEWVMVLPLPKTPPLDLQAPLSAEWREGERW